MLKEFVLTFCILEPGMSDEMCGVGENRIQEGSRNTQESCEEFKKEMRGMIEYAPETCTSELTTFGDMVDDPTCQKNGRTMVVIKDCAVKEVRLDL